MNDELLDRFRRDGDRSSYQRLVELQRPLVASVCRRLLRDPNDVDDAVQETFMKLAGSAQLIKEGSSLSAWLAATAHTTSIDLIRRCARERKRRKGMAQAGGINGERDVEHGALHQEIRSRLREALNVMEPAQRELLVARYIARAPLREIAARAHTSVPTASRRMAAAIAQLAEVLRHMGVRGADNQAVAQHFADPFNTEAAAATEPPAMRFAADWSSPELAPLGTLPLQSFGNGWTRPIRLGVVVSYETTITRGAHGFFGGMYEQVRSSLYVPTVGVQLVGVVEPGTVHRGIVERTLRDYRLLGGLIEADDVEGLGTLDVLLIGNNFALSDSIVRAVNRAVRGGMGLLNEYWTSRSEGRVIMPELQELMLSGSPYFSFHTRPCGQPLPVRVLREHPLLPGLKVGMRMMLNGCGPAYRPVHGAQMLLAKEMRVGADEHGMIGEPAALPMPAYLLGQLGRGRIAAVHAWPHEVFTRSLATDREQYFVNLLRWLSEPRREMFLA